MDPEYRFHDMIFFILTSISIIGYGSTIVSTRGRIAIIFLMLFAIFKIP